VIRLAVIALLAAGCAATTPAGGPAMATSADDREAIRAAVTALVHDIDGKQWDALPALFAAEVETDYRSLFGGDVQRQPATALVAAWRQILSPLDATQHQLGPIAVAIEGDRATARCHVRGYHVRSGLPGGGEWMVAGHYVIALARSDGAWKLAGIRLDTLYQTGNRALLQEAGAAR
jgi:hypothetical protein